MGQNAHGGGWGKAGVGKDADVTASACRLDRHLHYPHVHLPGPQDLSNLVLPSEERRPSVPAQRSQAIALPVACHSPLETLVAGEDQCLVKTLGLPSVKVR